MTAVRILPDAAHELLDASSFYDGARPGLGDAFATEFYALLDRIVLLPNAWPQVSKGMRRGLLKRFPYAVIFRYHEDDLVIHAVTHTKRHPDAWLRGGKSP